MSKIKIFKIITITEGNLRDKITNLSYVERSPVDDDLFGYRIMVMKGERLYFQVYDIDEKTGDAMLKPTCPGAKAGVVFFETDGFLEGTKEEIERIQLFSDPGTPIYLFKIGGATDKESYLGHQIFRLYGVEEIYERLIDLIPETE